MCIRDRRRVHGITFEEEYRKQYNELVKKLDQTSEYYKFLQNDYDSDNTLQIHKGYFSGDKGNADEKVKAGVDEILKDKKKLLSFESPSRFIFSIWALQEGWDNPNVFTICKLSNQGSEISKLQQIGRGLRICVNQNLQRYTLKNLNDNQEEFWRINNLDVVVSSKEQGFVEGIQNEILSNSFLISETFTEQELKRLLKEKSGFDDITVRNIFKTLDNKEIIVYKATVDGIDIYQKSPDFSAILKEQNLPEEQVKVIKSLFATDAKTYVQNGNNKKEKKKVFIKASHLRKRRHYLSRVQKPLRCFLWKAIPVCFGATIQKQKLHLKKNIESNTTSLQKNLTRQVNTTNFCKTIMTAIIHCRSIKDIFQATKEMLMKKQKQEWMKSQRTKRNYFRLRVPHGSFSPFGLCRKGGITRMFLLFVNFPIKGAKYQNCNKLVEVYAFVQIKTYNDIPLKI
eukprot:TRINITY_DN13156_c0_g1_i4.p1 TRINITY_DN13156_c0_g1~~TRINITY_DN13156_c0_g1_i4.p1  ORF type:complete len:455 (-),score=15.10 TRINITY_DN13156_c0_g1_i4:337-1701(-)